MPITTISSRQFNQDAAMAKRSAQNGPVFITDRGRPAHVLLTYKEYLKIVAGKSKIVDLLTLAGAEDIELTIPKFNDFPKHEDLS